MQAPRSLAVAVQRERGFAGSTKLGFNQDAITLNPASG
jgi:hypothetical protein